MVILSCMGTGIVTKTYGKKADSVWIVCPFSKPEFFNNLKKNIEKQTKKDKIKICVIENGEAIGICKKNGFYPDLLLTSEKHQSHAKNTGLEKVKKVGGEFWTTFDCDDFYGERYIEELLENSNKGDIIGKNKIFIKTTEDKLWLPIELKENCYVKYVHGPTISGWVEDFINFPIKDWAEDLAWTEAMQNIGAITYSTSAYNFCYNRFKSGNHTFISSDENYVKFSSDDILEWDLDYGIVCGASVKTPDRIIPSKNNKSQ